MDRISHSARFQSVTRGSYWSHHRAVQSRATAKINAEHKARDPLDFYWKQGVKNMRRQFGKLLDFDPKPEQFYNEGKYR